jgi:solute carrier family 50 (sugar transporter)
MHLPVPGHATVPLGITAVTEDETHVMKSMPSTTPTPEPPEPTIPDYEFLLKLIAIGSNILLQLSPMRQVIDAKYSGAEIATFPLLALTACGYQWSYYGYFAYSITENPGFLMLVYANILGLVLGVYYLFMVRWNTKEGLLMPQVWVLTSIFLFEHIICNYFRNFLAPSNLLILAGGLSASVSILVSVSPIVAIPELIRKRSTNSFPVDMCIASLLSSLLWLACGYLLRDPWVWLPNGIGVAVGSAQLAIVAWVHGRGERVIKID